MIRYILATVGLILAGAIFFLFTKPMYDSTQGLSAQSAQYDQALAKADELQKLKQTLLAQYNAFNPSDLDRIQKLLPDHVDNVALILDLDNLASHYAMPIENVDVSTPASSTGSPGTINTLGSSGQKYDSVTIHFTTRGTYTNFLALLRDLESSLRIVDLVSLDLTPDSIAQNGNAEPIYSYSLMLRTYWLK